MGGVDDLIQGECIREEIARQSSMELSQGTIDGEGLDKEVEKKTRAELKHESQRKSGFERKAMSTFCDLIFSKSSKQLL